MKRELDAQLVRSALEAGDLKRVAQLLRGVPAADAADFMANVPAEDAPRILRLLENEQRADVFGYLEPADQVRLSEHMPRRELARLFEAMSHDERADLFQSLEPEQRRELLPGLAHAEREDLRRLSSYPEGTAGSIMTSDYAVLAPEQTAAEALEALRLSAPDAETIYQAYVVDGARQLLGTLSLRDLFLARPERKVRDLMQCEVIDGRTDEATEDVARRIARYDLLALPILDDAGTLVGIVTYDDAMDVAEDAATEDFYKSANVGKLTGGVKRAKLHELYRKRVPWLLLLVFGNLFSGAGLALFEGLLARHVALIFFLPLLVGSAGNAGSQAATLMVRALATGEAVLSDWLFLLGREVAVAGALGLSMALAVAGLGWARGGAELAIVISTTMVLVVLFGGLVGTALPFLFSRFRLDPASASGPLVTTLADVSGVLIYLSLANWLLAGP